MSTKSVKHKTKKQIACEATPCRPVVIQRWSEPTAAERTNNAKTITIEFVSKVFWVVPRSDVPRERPGEVSAEGRGRRRRRWSTWLEPVAVEHGARQ